MSVSDVRKLWFNEARLNNDGLAPLGLAQRSPWLATEMGTGTLLAATPAEALPDVGDLRNRLTCHVTWARAGYPAFKLGREVTAAMLLTDLKSLVPVEVRPPFDSFFVELPWPNPAICFPMQVDGREYMMGVHAVHAAWLDVPVVPPKKAMAAFLPMLPSLLTGGFAAAARKSAQVEAALLSGPRKRVVAIRIFAADTGGSEVWNDLIMQAEEPTGLLDEWDETFAKSPADMTIVDDGDDSHEASTPAAEELRARSAVVRTVVNLTTYLSSQHAAGLPFGTRVGGNARREAQGRGLARPAPVSWVVGEDVKLDAGIVSAAWQQAVTGRNGWRLENQHIVRGHWKQQVHGLGRALRRKMWIKPYWRGPEDAAGTIRGYEVTP